MPRRQRKNAIAEFGDQWIAYLPHSSSLYRFWLDPRVGRTRWESLRTTDLEEAKLKLAQIILQGAAVVADAPLAVVLEKYFLEHSDQKASKGVARSAGSILLDGLGADICASEVGEAKQREFVKNLIAGGFKLSYAARILTVLAAAFRHAGIAQPSIIYAESKMKARWHLTSAEPKKAYIPTDQECAQLFNADMPDSLRRCMIICALTAARPGAVVELAPSQRNRSAAIIDLNPQDRPQNKKYRPVVRETRVLRRFLSAWEKAGLGPFGDRYAGYTTVEGAKTALERLRGKLGISQLSTYSGRHKATTILRRARVQEDQIAAQLGHRRPGLRITGGYGEWDPSYLQEAADALDAWFLRVRKMARALAKSQVKHKPGHAENSSAS